ncbi:amidohydrolase [Plantibacter sp. Mn2098]|uniref:amidohydrolase n=1 Tax=Plantibacter sp. Mn2098 TaxID=3395266 RepID=UPI003BD8DDD2
MTGESAHTASQPALDALVTVVRGARVSGPHQGGVSGAEPVDIVLRDGEIVEIALSGTSTTGPHAVIIDAAGGYVLPGLWDHHVHFTQWAQTSRRIDLSGATSAADAARIVGERAGAGSGRIEGALFRDALWSDAPHRSLLDAVAPDREVVLVSADLHCSWLNSAALVALGIGDHPTGLLREEESFSMLKQLDSVPEEVSDRWVADAAAAAAARGVVGIVDLEMRWNAGDWLRRAAAGHRSLRVEFGIYPEHLDRAIGAGLASGAILAGTDGLIEVGPFKVITDGSLNTRTAYCDDVYPGLEGTRGAHGILSVDPEHLTALLRVATSSGLRCAVHAIGDRANSFALDAIAETGAAGSIEHAQLVRDVDVPRFAELGIAASVQPEHAMDDRDVADVQWAGRTDRAFVLRSLLDASARVLLGSDAPVAPLDPWVSISAAVGRSRDGREPWHPEQALTIDEAIEASTRTGLEYVGVGQPADLIVVDRDPFTATADELRTMPVRLTLLGGAVTHRA